jgi:hypothetical protein
MNVVTGVSGLPRYFVIDRDGRLFSYKTQGDLTQVVTDLLSAAAPASDKSRSPSLQ